MRFLYTGSQLYLTPQNDPYKSLGGFVSSSVVPNGRLNSLFADASYSGVTVGSVECRALILQNESGVTVNSLTLGYQYSANPDFDIQIAVVTLNSNQIMEQIGNARDLPYIGTFSEANIDPSIPVDNSLQLGSLAANACLGVWIKRIQNVQTLTPVDFSIPLSPKIDGVTFIITWE